MVLGIIYEYGRGIPPGINLLLSEISPLPFHSVPGTTRVQFLFPRALCEYEQKFKEVSCVSITSWGLHKTLAGEGKGKSVETRFGKLGKEDTFSL